MKKLILLFLSVIFLTSCADNYHALKPEANQFNDKSTENGLEISYKYNSLRKKYKKYADRNDIRIVSVKLKNTTDKDLTFGEDFVLTSYSGSQLSVLSTEEAFDKTKQHPASHLWYLLLSFIQIQTYETNQYGQQEVSGGFPVGLIIGPGLCFGNMIVASNANTQYKTELTSNELYNKTIKPGETLYGLLPIRSNNYPAIKSKLLNN